MKGTNLPPNPRLPRSSLSFSLHSQSPFLQPSPHRSISPPPPFPLPLPSSSSRSSSLLLKFTQIHRRLHQRYAARPSSTTPNFTITHAANQTCLTSSQPLCTSSLGPPDQDSWSAFAFKASPNSSACTQSDQCETFDSPSTQVEISSSKARTPTGPGSGEAAIAAAPPAWQR